MSKNRLWLVLVLALFCLPLFVGLGRRDLRGDEAAYSFGIDRILEIGQWLEPKSSPDDNAVFLEKPPLTFWIVAAPIRFRLLPNDEFGLRFWGALFGGLAFLYVFAIGHRLAGSLCGAVAAMILFVHDPLLFAHGLRSNNTEAPLLLCYCGGVYHYFAWISAQRAGPRRLHAVASGLYFVLGFMTKDVAALFLPLFLGLATALVGAYRTKLIRDWHLWGAVSLLVLALCAPWFVYAYLRFGSALWETMLAVHVYTRFTSYLDPAHAQPWYYYFVTTYRNVVNSQSAIPVLAGLVLLTVETIRRRWPEGLVLLLWLWLPVCLISLGTSKLYHYLYPFLPPVALAGGYFIAFLVARAHPYIARALGALDAYAANRMPHAPAIFERPAVRSLLLAITASAVGVAIVTLVYGPIRLNIGDSVVFRSSGLLRPLLIALVFGVLARAIRSANLVIVPMLVAAILPLSAYREVLSRLNMGEHPLRSAADCVLRVAARPALAPSGSRGLYVAGPQNVFGHEHYYYFHRVRPLERAARPSPERLGQYLDDPSQQRPVLIAESSYRDFNRNSSAGPLPLVDFQDGVVLLLPGPYAVCSAGVTGPTAHR